MSTTATLDSRVVSLEAGTEGSVRLHIRNDGEIVEEYRFRVVGPGRAWTEVVPGLVSLYPGQDATASVEFRPPRSSVVPAGALPYGVQVLPTEHPEDAVVPEGVLHLLPFHETTAELMPRTSRAPLGARHRVAVDNYGNVPITVSLTGSDPGELLDISWRGPALTVEPGTVQFAQVRVRGLGTIWRGTPVTHAFTVAVKPMDGPPVVLDGMHVQEPVLPSWIFKAVALLVLFALVLVALWFLLIRPAEAPLAKAAAQDRVVQSSGLPPLGP